MGLLIGKDCFPIATQFQVTTWKLESIASDSMTKVKLITGRGHCGTHLWMFGLTRRM